MKRRTVLSGLPWPHVRASFAPQSFLLKPQSFSRRPSFRLGRGLSLPGHHCRPRRQTAGAFRSLMFAGVGDLPGSWSRRGQVVIVPILPFPVLEACPLSPGQSPGAEAGLLPRPLLSTHPSAATQCDLREA